MYMCMQKLYTTWYTAITYKKERERKWSRPPTYMDKLTSIRENNWLDRYLKQSLICVSILAAQVISTYYAVVVLEQFSYQNHNLIILIIL